MKVYAKIGSFEQHIGKAPFGAILMPFERPSKNHICVDQGDGTGVWELDLTLQWKEDMVSSDSLMTQAIEEIWDVIGINKAPIETQNIYNEKKIIRSKKP